MKPLPVASSHPPGFPPPTDGDGWASHRRAAGICPLIAGAAAGRRCRHHRRAAFGNLLADDNAINQCFACHKQPIYSLLWLLYVGHGRIAVSAHASCPKIGMVVNMFGRLNDSSYGLTQVLNACKCSVDTLAGNKNPNVPVMPQISFSHLMGLKVQCCYRS